MSRFEQAIIGKEHSVGKRIVLYGVEGIGKTETCCKVPSGVLIQTEDGARRIEGIQKMPVRVTWEEFLLDIRALLTDKHEYKNVVIDSIDWAERLLFDFVARQEGVESIGAIGYGKGYALAADIMRKVLQGLSMVASRGVNVIVIGHSKIQRFESPTHPPYDRYCLALHDKLSGLVVQWAEAVLFVNYKISVMAKEERAVGQGERVIYTAERPAYSAKNRFGLPHEMPFEILPIINA